MKKSLNKKELAEKLRGRKLEFGLLSVVLIFGMIYFTYGTIQNHSFGRTTRILI